MYNNLSLILFNTNQYLNENSHFYPVYLHELNNLTFTITENCTICERFFCLRKSFTLLSNMQQPQPNNVPPDVRQTYARW